MVYEEEATFISAFLSSLVDMRLLPDRLRRLEQPSWAGVRKLPAP
jgi:hypothetical protein